MDKNWTKTLLNITNKMHHVKCRDSKKYKSLQNKRENIYAEVRKFNEEKSR